MRSLVTWICSAVVLLLAGPAWSCSPPIGDVPELTKAQSAHFAETILVGKILETYVNTDTHYGGEAYSAAMKVYCIYKGDVSAGVVNITDVGIVPGLCHSSNLVKGSEYIVYLDGQELRIMEAEIENTEQHRLEVSKACGLNLQYPEGISKEDLPHSCPEPASETECTPEYDYDEVTMHPPPPGPPGHNDQDHDHDSHGHESHDIEGHDHEGHGHEGHGHDEYDHDGHDHVGHTHEEHDKHDQKDKQEHAEHDDEHDHDGHDHDGHDHEGHGHDDYDHDGHDHVGHTHEEHDKHDQEHEHEHDEGHDHEHDHDHDDHDHGGHDHEGHGHDEYDHKGHDHEGHTHEEHDKHDQSHEDEHQHTVKTGASLGSDESSSSRGSCAIGVLLLSLGICLSL